MASNKKIKANKLLKWMKEIIQDAPEKYKDQYNDIIGYRKVHLGITTYIAYVTSNGILMLSTQPFHMVTEDDWKPKYFKDEEKAAAYCEQSRFKYLDTAKKEAMKNYGIKKNTGLYLPKDPFILYPTNSEGWYMVFSKIQPTRWVFNESITEIIGFSLEWIFLKPFNYIGDILELDNGKKAKILIIKKAKFSELNNPLLYLEFMNEEKQQTEDEDELIEWYTENEWKDLGYELGKNAVGTMSPDEDGKLYCRKEMFCRLSWTLNHAITSLIKSRNLRYTQYNKFLTISEILENERKEYKKLSNDDPLTFTSIMTQNVCVTFGRNLMDTAALAEYFTNIVFPSKNSYWGDPNHHKALMDGWRIPEDKRCKAYREIISKKNIEQEKNIYQ